MLLQRKGGREGIIKYELIFDISSCISKRYIKKEGVGNFLLWMQKELFHWQCAKNLLETQYFRLSAAKVCLVSYQRDYIHHKISGWPFQKQGFMSWQGKEQNQ